MVVGVCYWCCFLCLFFVFCFSFLSSFLPSVLFFLLLFLLLLVDFALAGSLATLKSGIKVVFLGKVHSAPVKTYSDLGFYKVGVSIKSGKTL